MFRRNCRAVAGAGTAWRGVGLGAVGGRRSGNRSCSSVMVAVAAMLAAKRAGHR